MLQQREHPPGEAAPATAIYEQRNVFGTPTGVRVEVARGDPLPLAPRGYSWVAVKQEPAVPDGAG